MLNVVAFFVPGEPQGKGRPRATIINGSASLYTPKKTVSYEGLVAHFAHQAMRGHNLFEAPCRIEIDVLCSVPASWSQRKQRQALEGTLRPAKTPDADNVLKAICDGINGVVWKDDALAVEGCWTKIYADTPGVRVRVAKLTDVDGAVRLVNSMRAAE